MPEKSQDQPFPWMHERQTPVISGNKKARPKSGSFLERVKGIKPS